MRKYFSDVVGNDELCRYFGDEIRRDMLPHAFILEGPKGSGKHMLATRLAMALSCEKRSDPNANLPCAECPTCKKILSGNSPDLIFVNRGDKTEFGVDPVRFVNSDVYFSPNENEKKVYVFEDAQLMNIQAQNAFLLTLEEPPPYVVFVLLTESATVLLETVRSRAQVRRIERIPNAEIKKLLIERYKNAKVLNDTNPDALDEIILSAGGCIGTAIELLDEKKRDVALGKREKVRNFVSLLAGGDTRASIEMLTALSRSKQTREQLTAFFVHCKYALRDLILLRKDENAPLCFYTNRDEALHLSGEVSLERLVRVADALDFAVERLGGNGNVRLVLTTLWMQSGLLQI